MIDCIGEDLLKRKLQDLYNEFYKIETTEDKYLKRIKELESILRKNKND